MDGLMDGRMLFRDTLAQVRQFSILETQLWWLWNVWLRLLQGGIDGSIILNISELQTEHI